MLSLRPFSQSLQNTARPASRLLCSGLFVAFVGGAALPQAHAQLPIKEPVQLLGPVISRAPNGGAFAGMDIFSTGRFDGLLEHNDYSVGIGFNGVNRHFELRSRNGYNFMSSGGNYRLLHVNPNGNLHLLGGLVAYENDKASSRIYLGQGRNKDFSLIFNSVPNAWGRIGNRGALSFWTNGRALTDDAPQMLLDQAGNLTVGPGTSPTTARLMVQGNLQTNGNVAGQTMTVGNDLTVNRNLELAGKINGFSLRTLRNSDPTLLMENGMVAYCWKRIGGDGPLAFWANGGADTDDSPQLLLTMAGNLGVGTTNATEKLTVVGNVRATAFLADASRFPDYVFEADYQLRPLAELQAYVQREKHLPGMPTQAQVVAGGLNLKEVSIKSVEKIEELTLYILALSKKVESLEAQLRAQQSK